ncbi:hypothetical protein G6O67_001097 [Ophiocordyceps sinensis]|uniref:Uncharacterized protein n=1 Tax=Ophiocordyceps sinensis TaxID=72228 RepID=A0A8H4V8Q9_9HYPO|nr:hypothetical protein G6O67_001097 [Ophiocordyceps sinensis]
MCEAGVDESTTESNSRPELMFYELSIWDPLGTMPWKRSSGAPLSGTFLGRQQATPRAAAVLPVANLELLDVQVPSLLPDGYGRVFHPEMLLHQMPAWLPQGKVASGVGTSGSCIKWAKLLVNNYTDYVAVDATNGAIVAWLNRCDTIPSSTPLARAMSVKY